MYCQLEQSSFRRRIETIDLETQSVIFSKGTDTIMHKIPVSPPNHSYNNKSEGPR